MNNLEALAPYAEWLERLCETVAKKQPYHIAIVMEDEDEIHSAYFGGPTCYDKMHLGDVLRSDGMMDMVLKNAKAIEDAAEEQEDSDIIDGDDG